jgi:LPPG:FO 2-phospho-L-lactate transferase
MDELTDLGGAAWFRLGDRDLATHLYRSQRLAEGATKTEVTRELAQHHGVKVTLLPVSDDPIATEFVTDDGRLSFQEYFVQRHHDVVVRGVDVVGATSALPTKDVERALAQCDRLVIAPSNPLISIEPMLQVPGVREALRERRDDVVAISPIIRGAALKGPADRLLRELGYESSALGVVEYYGDLVGTWIIDDADADLADSIRARGVRVEVTTTIMAEPDNARRLAKVVLS